MRSCFLTLSVAALTIACSEGPEQGPENGGSDESVDTAVGESEDGDSDEPDEPAFDAVAEVETLLVGHFDSAQQAADDRDYFHILLTMCPVSMPELGARVLYVEQTSADTPSEPYRQRLYVLEAGATEQQAVSRVFEIAGPRQYTGTCDDVESFEMDLDRAIELEGCDVVLDWNGEVFEGGTVDDACGTDWGGASYATSEITLGEAVLLSWDRGFDASGQQVWGATGGGYQFVRQTALGSW